MVREDAARLPADLSKAKRLGLPLTPDDIARLTPKVPDSQNAAPIYRQAMREFVKAFGADGSRYLHAATPREQLLLAEKSRKAFEPIFTLIREAVKKPYCQFPYAFNCRTWTVLGFDDPKNDDKIFRYFAYKIHGQVLGDIKAHRLQAALEKLDTVAQMTKHGAPYDVVFNGSWAVSADSLVCNDLLKILHKDWQNPATVKKVKQVASTLQMPNFYQLMQTEFVLGLTTIQEMKSLEEIGLDRNIPKPVSEAIDSCYQSPGVKEAFEARYLGLYIKTFSDLPKNSQAWPAIYQSLTRAHKELDQDRTVDIAVARMLTPVYPNAEIQFGTTQALRRIVLASAELIQTYAREGKFPSELNPLSPESIDPMSGKRMHYHANRNGFTLYSIGANMRDDGGVRAEWNSGKDEDDITFRFDLSEQPAAGRVSGAEPPNRRMQMKNS